MPNGAQTPTEEGEASGSESQGEEEWDSDVAGDDDDDDDDDGDDDDAEDEEEEEEVVPPRSERRSKLVHDPSTERGKGVATQSTKRPRTTSPAPTEKAPKGQGRGRSPRTITRSCALQTAALLKIFAQIALRPT